MHRSVGIVASLLAAHGVCLGAPPETELAFHLGYEPGSDCPTSAEFEQAVASRAPGARAVGRAEAAIVFDVALTPRTDGVSAALVATLPDGTPSRRDVTGESCSEAVSTLAVIAALALNGYREAKEAAPSAADTPEGPAAMPPLEVDSPPARVAVASPPADVTNGEKRKPSSERASVRPGAFVSGAWESAVAPTAPFGGFLGVELGFRRHGAWWPSVRAGVLATLTATETRPEGSATFRLTTARLVFCPLGFGDDTSPSVHACLELDAGKLDARGSGADVRAAAPRSMPWFATGTAARGEWPLAAWVAVEGFAGFRVLARHDRFVFQPETLVYDVPPLSAGLGLGIVGRIP